MATQSSVNLEIANLSVGFSIRGGTTKRTLTVNGSGNTTLTSQQNIVLTLPNRATDTVIGYGDYSAKGVLLVGTGAGTFSALSVGADNTVLTAASAQSTGLTWSSFTPGQGVSVVSGDIDMKSTGVKTIGSTASGARFLPLKLYVIGSNVSGGGTTPTGTIGTNSPSWNNLQGSTSWGLANTNEFKLYDPTLLSASIPASTTISVNVSAASTQTNCLYKFILLGVYY